MKILIRVESRERGGSRVELTFAGRSGRASLNWLDPTASTFQHNHPRNQFFLLYGKSFLVPGNALMACDAFSGFNIECPNGYRYLNAGSCYSMDAESEEIRSQKEPPKLILATCHHVQTLTTRWKDGSKGISGMSTKCKGKSYQSSVNEIFERNLKGAGKWREGRPWMWRRGCWRWWTPQLHTEELHPTHKTPSLTKLVVTRLILQLPLLRLRPHEHSYESRRFTRQRAWMCRPLSPSRTSTPKTD